MRALIMLLALAAAAETPRETIKPSAELRARLNTLETEQKSINDAQQSLIARQRAVSSEAEEIRVRVCWEAGVSPQECGAWSGGEVLKIPKSEVKK